MKNYFDHLTRNHPFFLCGVAGITVLTASPIKAAPDPNFHCYLLFGQSNMAGGGAGVALGGNSGALIAADCDTSTRVKRLAFCDCYSLSPAPCNFIQLFVKEFV